MDNRLKYKKHSGIDNIITIDLNNNYTTIAIIENERLGEN